MDEKCLFARASDAAGRDLLVPRCIKCFLRPAEDTGLVSLLQLRQLL